MAETAALSPRSFPQSSTGRFNAESIFMRRERLLEQMITQSFQAEPAVFQS